MINKFEELMHHWGLTDEDERAFTRFLANKHPNAATEGLRDARSERTVTPEIAVQIIGEVYGFTPEQIAAPGRKREAPSVLRCRATVIDLLNHQLIFNIGRPEIGKRFMGGRDNSTLIYTWRTHFKWDADYEQAVMRLCDVMGLDTNELIQALKTDHGIASDSETGVEAEARSGDTREVGL